MSDCLFNVAVLNYQSHDLSSILLNYFYIGIGFLYLYIVKSRSLYFGQKEEKPRNLLVSKSLPAKKNIVAIRLFSAGNLWFYLVLSGIFKNIKVLIFSVLIFFCRELYVK